MFGSSFRDLVAWQVGMDLVAEIYRITALFPPAERFGLVQQTRRAAMSIPENIAEGHGRQAIGAFAVHLQIARGSAKEVETYLCLASRLGLVDGAALARGFELTARSCQLLSRLTEGLRRRQTSPSRT